MITKKRLLASAALAMFAAWSLTHAAGQGNMAPAAPAPKFGASLDGVAAVETPQALPALPAAIRSRADALFTDADDVGQTRALIVLRAALAAKALPHAGSQVADHVTMSVGVAQFDPATMEGFDALLHRADQALYRAKAEGRDRVVI